MIKKNGIFELAGVNQKDISLLEELYEELTQKQEQIIEKFNIQKVLKSDSFNLKERTEFINQQLLNIKKPYLEQIKINNLRKGIWKKSIAINPKN